MTVAEKARTFDESQVNRHPEGTDEGGRFAPKDGGGTATAEASPLQEWADENGLQVVDDSENFQEIQAGIGREGFVEHVNFYPKGLSNEDILELDEPSATFAWNDKGSGVEVHEVVVSESLQGKGAGSRILGYMSERAQADGKTALTMTANMDAGGYAWARMGFAPPNDWGINRVAAQMAANRGRLDARDRQVFARYLRQIDRRSYGNRRRALWDFVDSEPVMARTVLKGTSYRASLTFADDEAMERFNRYVTRGKK